jgi:DNA-directed RNA polymerase subunit H (RpoH/RPB5)
MPTPQIKSFAQKAGKSVSKVERLWDRAVELAKDNGWKESDDKFYAYVTGILKKMLSIKENLVEELEILLNEDKGDKVLDQCKETLDDLNKVNPSDSKAKHDKNNFVGVLGMLIELSAKKGKLSQPVDKVKELLNRAKEFIKSH